MCWDHEPMDWGLRDETLVGLTGEQRAEEDEVTPSGDPVKSVAEEEQSDGDGA